MINCPECNREHELESEYIKPNDTLYTDVVCDCGHIIGVALKLVVVGVD